MDLTEAIAAINASEIDNKATIVAAINARTGALNSESASWQRKYKKASGEIERLNELIGEDGKDAEATIKELKESNISLEKDKAKLEQQIKDSSAKNKQLELNAIAAKSGINIDNFSKFVSKGIIDSEQLKVDGEEIKIGDRPLQEFAKSEGSWMVAALFESSNAEGTENSAQDEKAKAPAGGTKGKSKSNSREVGSGIFAGMNDFKIPLIS